MWLVEIDVLDTLRQRHCLIALNLPEKPLLGQQRLARQILVIHCKSLDGLRRLQHSSLRGRDRKNS